MKKQELDERLVTLKSETKDALQLVWNNVNQGQRKQIIKKPEIKALFDRYGVDYE